MNIFDEHPWHGLDGEVIEDIRKHIERYLNNRYTMHVGTDSKPYPDSTTMVTTVCFREKGKGVVVAYQKYKITAFPAIRDRLVHETVVSLEVADALVQFTGDRPTIHADVNPKKEALSNVTLDAIIGMIKGMGYPVLVKPEAWAADIADMYTR